MVVVVTSAMLKPGLTPPASCRQPTAASPRNCQAQAYVSTSQTASPKPVPGLLITLPEQPGPLSVWEHQALEPGHSACLLEVQELSGTPQQPVGDYCQQPPYVSKAHHNATETLIPENASLRQSQGFSIPGTLDSTIQLSASSDQPVKTSAQDHTGTKHSHLASSTQHTSNAAFGSPADTSQPFVATSLLNVQQTLDVSHTTDLHSAFQGNSHIWSPLSQSSPRPAQADDSSRSSQPSQQASRAHSFGAALCHQIAACQSYAELHDLLTHHRSQVNAINISAALSLVKRLSRQKHLLVERRRAEPANHTKLNETQSGPAGLHSYQTYSKGSQGTAGDRKAVLELLQRLFIVKLSNPSTQLIIRNAIGSRHLHSMPHKPHGTTPSSRELCNCIHTFAKLNHPLPPEANRQFLVATYKQLASFKPTELANTLWALARMGIRPTHAWMTAFYKTAFDSAESFTPQELSMVLWASVTLGYRPTRVWLYRWQCACASAFPSSSTYDLAQMLWAFARMELQPSSEWLHDCLSHLQAKLAEANAQDVCTALWALARLKYHPGGHFICACLAHLFPDLQSSANLQPSLSTSPHPSTSLRRGKGQALAQAASNSCNPAGLQPLGSVTGRTQKHASTARTTARKRSVPVTKPLSAVDCSHLLWALASMKVSLQPAADGGRPFWDRLLENCISTVPHCSSQDIATMFHTLGMLQHKPKHAVKLALVTQLQAVLDKMEPQGLTLVLWACMRTQLQLPQPVFIQLLNTCTACIRHFDPKGVSLLLYSLHKHKYTPRPEFLNELLQQVSATIQECSSQRSSHSSNAAAPCCSGQTLSLLVWSLAKLRYRPTNTWIRQLLVHTVQVLPTLSVQEQVNLIWGLATLQMPLDELWMVPFMQCVQRQLPNYCSHGINVLLGALDRLRWVPTMQFLAAWHRFAAVQPALAEMQHIKRRVSRLQARAAKAAGSGINVFDLDADAVAFGVDAVARVADSSMQRMKSIDLTVPTSTKQVQTALLV